MGFPETSAESGASAVSFGGSEQPPALQIKVLNAKNTVSFADGIGVGIWPSFGGYHFKYKTNRQRKQILCRYGLLPRLMKI